MKKKGDRLYINKNIFKKVAKDGKSPLKTVFATENEPEYTIPGYWRRQHSKAVLTLSLIFTLKTER